MNHPHNTRHKPIESLCYEAEVNLRLYNLKRYYHLVVIYPDKPNPKRQLQCLKRLIKSKLGSKLVLDYKLEHEVIK